MRPTRISVLIVGAVLFASSPSAAAPWQEREPSSALVQLWNQLTAFLSGKIGCIIDPGGSCRERAEIGCGIDPSGCRDTATATHESGCGIDPDGHCRDTAAPAGDIGCVADPSGSCGSLGRGQLDPNG